MKQLLSASVSWKTVIFWTLVTNLWTTLLLRMLRVMEESSHTDLTTVIVPEYSLAYEQSFGFFDDIKNEDWKRFYQTPAREARHYRVLDDRLKGIKFPAQWNFFNWDPYFPCPHKRKIGGLGGGPKWTCDAERLVRIANERPDKSCLIYSIGSRGNYLWELGLVDLWGKPLCEIHVFDFGDFQRNDTADKNIHYHRWGLGSSYSQRYRKRAIERGQTFLSFQEIRRRLGHEDRTIDLFKIDCEGCEWHNYKDWITADIRQIMIETHDLPLPSTEKDTLFGMFPAIKATDFFDTMKANGFALYSKEVNSQRGFGRSVEWSFIKLRRDFFGPLL